METFALIIIGIIISLVSNAKKKAQTEAKREEKAVQVPASPAKRPEPVTLDSDWEVPRMETVVPAAPTIGTEGTDTYHDYMLPVFAPRTVPAAASMESAAVPAADIGTEGADACHEYMLEETPVTVPVQTTDTGLTAEEARDLMRGIILSEIMTRPQQRFAGRKR